MLLLLVYPDKPESQYYSFLLSNSRVSAMYESPQILNLSKAPKDPVKRIVWLAGVQARVREELDRELSAAYFDVRMRGQLDEVLSLGYHSKKQALAWSRKENDRRGRVVRWGDGKDRTSSAYSG